MGILTQEEADRLDYLKIRLVNDLWAAENTALDETSWARMRQRLKCIHHDADEAFELLGMNPINEDDQSVPYPFSENGGGKE